MKKIDQKLTTPVHPYNAFASYTKSQYGMDGLKTAENAIQMYIKMRNDLAQSQGKGGFASQKDLCCRYLQAAAILSERFPLGPRGVNVQFSWTDALRPTSRCTLPDWNFEIASIIFNIGALYSAMGINEDRSSPDGMKKAVKCLQTAAGIFSYLRDQIICSIVGQTTADLKEPFLSMCVSLMSAETHCCFYEKGVKDKLNRSLLSKMANQIAQQYAAALNYCIQSSAPQTLANEFRVQELAYTGVAHYQRGMSEKEEAEKKCSGFGSVIARFDVAKISVNEALKKAQASGIPLQLQSLLTLITQEHASMTKDNNVIYLDVIPSPTALAPLEAISTIKITPIRNLTHIWEGSTLDPVFNQCVSALLPQPVRVALESFRNSSEILIQQLKSEHTEISANIHQQLTNMGLPYIEQTVSARLPDQLWAKVQSVQSKGGWKAVQETLKMLSSLAAAAKSNMTELSEILTNEQISDEECRRKYGNRWTRPDSSVEGGRWRKAISELQQKLQTAETVDAGILKNFQNSINLYALLDKTRAELENQMPTGVTNTPSVSKQKVIECMEPLDDLTSALQTTIQTFQAEVLQTRPDCELMKAYNSKQPLETVVEDEMSRIQMDSTSVRDKMADALKQLEVVKSAHAALKSEEKGRNDPRTTYLTNIDRAADSVLEAHSSSTDGMNFYQRLLETVDRYKQLVNDFVTSRENERKRLESQL
eukprot:GHVL01005709.1.p1 GENE.GHVL01005709.1~~GHVL01005709.1.p1  ORF type:complete len:708 (-),score=105.37 GHVL01005709.1:180-2303(-)